MTIFTVILLPLIIIGVIVFAVGLIKSRKQKRPLGSVPKLALTCSASILGLGLCVQAMITLMSVAGSIPHDDVDIDDAILWAFIILYGIAILVGIILFIKDGIASKRESRPRKSVLTFYFTAMMTWVAMPVVCYLGVVLYTLIFGGDPCP